MFIGSPRAYEERYCYMVTKLLSPLLPWQAGYWVAGTAFALSSFSPVTKRTMPLLSPPQDAVLQSGIPPFRPGTLW